MFSYWLGPSAEESNPRRTTPTFGQGGFDPRMHGIQVLASN